VDNPTAQQLLRLNAEFYQSFAPAFASTRQRPQPGVKRLLGRIPAGASVLDLGCAHGQIALMLQARGWQGRYVGVDSSPDLLAAAASHPGGNMERVLLCLDLAEPGWSRELQGEFDWILLLAVLHHIPGTERRAGILKETADLLLPGGRLALSVWNLPAYPRLADHLVEPASIGLTSQALDPGDVLIDWRQGGRGIRYVHGFGEQELDQLIEACGLTACEAYHSDGQGGNQGIYRLLQKARA
jgi:tRNA (uracil-5-)-methyltransferase TRM9